MLSCQSHQLDINDVLSKANSLRMVLMPDFQYHSIDGYSKQVLTVLNDFGILKEHFNTFLQEVNAAHCEQLFGSSLKQLPANKEPEVPKRGPGRPKGSKNKSTLAREAAEAAKKEAQAEVPKSVPDHPNGCNVESNTERDEQKLSHTTARKTGYDSSSSS